MNFSLNELILLWETCGEGSERVGRCSRCFDFGRFCGFFSGFCRLYHFAVVSVFTPIAIGFKKKSSLSCWQLRNAVHGIMQVLLAKGHPRREEAARKTPLEQNHTTQRATILSASSSAHTQNDQSETMPQLVCCFLSTKMQLSSLQVKQQDVEGCFWESSRRTIRSEATSKRTAAG